MVGTIFFTSDTHFGHKGICQFMRSDGVTKLRPWDDPEKMNEDMVELWNKVVRPEDKVYHLGDVVINRKYLPILSRLNGRKILIKGNHDIFKLPDYLPYFKDIRAYHVLNKMIFSHVPVHPESKGRFLANIHGHMHANKLDDPWYVNVSVEHTEYRPIAFEDLMKRVNAGIAQ